MKTKIFYILLSLSIFILSSCVEDNLYKDDTTDSEINLVINEVMSNMGDPNPDWIEIYNPSEVDVDISGFGVYDNINALFTIPSGTSIAPKGYYVIICDKVLATTDPANYANFGISSGGETVYFVDAAQAIVDQAEVPAMELGISWSRIPDGGEKFENANPTQGAANSNTNEPPVIEADTLVTGEINNNSRFQYDIIVKDASGISAVKFWLQTATETFYLDMAPLGGGVYRVLLPLLEQGKISYYIKAVDETGLETLFKPEDDDAFTINVTDGLALFNSVELSSENPSSSENIIVKVNVYDKSGITGVKLYYTVNDPVAANKITLDLKFVNGVWIDTIPGQDDESVIRYYLRAVDGASLKSYYPEEILDKDGNITGDFDHDDGSTWPQIVVAPLVVLDQLVINEINASGSPYDYIELFNGTAASMDISGYKVHDSGGIGVAYTIPAGTTIAAGGFYLIQTGSGAPQGTFGISGSGEDITLLNSSDVIVDKLVQADWPGTPLVIRKKDGVAVWITTSTPTPGATNN